MDGRQRCRTGAFEQARSRLRRGPRAAAQACDVKASRLQLVTPERVGDGGGRLLDQTGVDSPVGQVGVVEADDRHAGSLAVARRLGGEGGQLFLGLGAAPLEVGDLGGKEPGIEAAAFVDGRPGEALGERVVVAHPGCERSGQEQLGAATAPGEAQGRHAQGVLPAPSAGLLDLFRQAAGYRPLPQGAYPHAHHVPVDGMGEPELDPTAVHAACDQPLVLERLHRGAIGELGYRRLPEGLTEGQQLQHRRFRRREDAETQSHELHETARRPELAAKSQDADFVPERPALERPRHEFPQDHGIALAPVGELANRRRVDRSSQRRDEQLGDDPVLEDRDLDALGRAVLP